MTSQIIQCHVFCINWLKMLRCIESKEEENRLEENHGNEQKIVKLRKEAQERLEKIE